MLRTRALCAVLLFVFLGLCITLPFVAFAQDMHKVSDVDPDRLGTFIESLQQNEVLVEAEQGAPPVVVTHDPDLRNRQISYIIKHGASNPLANSILDNINNRVAKTVPVALVLAIMLKESTYRPNVRSRDGSYGLMQVRAKVHRKLIAKLGVKNILSVSGNILVGTTLLSTYLDKADGDVMKALTRYSGGSKEYASRVMKIMRTIPC